MVKEIASSANEKIKLVKSLADKKGRQACGLFVAEGTNLVKDMPDKSGALFVRKSDTDKHSAIIEGWQGEVYIAADNAFNSAADTVNSGGILALCPIPEAKPVSGGFVLVLDGISDPGNAGTLIRTACALGISDIVAVDSADFYNPKTIRASMGGVFHCNLVPLGRGEAIESLKDYTVAVLDMNGADVYYYKPPPRLALVVGNEARGVSAEFRERADKVLAVPMYGGKMESLNAAISAAIAMSALRHCKQAEKSI